MGLGGRLRTLRLRPQLASALDVELRAFDRMAMRVWQTVAVGGAIAGILFALVFPGPLGFASTAACAAYFLWFTFVHQRLKHGPLGPVIQTGTIVVESTVPWVFLALLVITEGASYAIGSWVPPMLVCAIVVGHGARLRGRAALLVGALGALTYPLTYFLWMAHVLEPEVEHIRLYQAPMQLTRTVALLAVGLIGLVLARGLRGAIARAEIAVRESELLGKYQLVRRIAHGGMGSIHEAVYCPEGGFERKVAIKRVHPHLAEEPRFVALFRSEAEISARLAHPNIVQVLDFGRVRDSYFLAMEYVDGLPLNRLLGRSARAGLLLPTELVGTIGRAILAGLVHAHEVALGADGEPLRVVHRDLCPQNVMVSRHGETKITDFGVARALKDAASSHTKTVVGHRGYLAPEQARGNPIDPRADIFPVGVMLWELLAGRRLFRGETEEATMQALLYGEVPLVSSIRPEIDQRWDAIVGKALARNPDDRWPTARRMLAELDDIPDSTADAAPQKLGALVARLAGEPPTGDEGETMVDTSPPTAS